MSRLGQNFQRLGLEDMGLESRLRRFHAHLWFLWKRSEEI